MREIKVVHEPIAEPEVIEVVQAEYIEGYCLRLWFNDETSHVVDFGPFLQNVQNPIFKQYLNLDKFKQFNLVYGNLDWNDYEMCFPVADLYTGNILKCASDEPSQPDWLRESVLSSATH